VAGTSDGLSGLDANWDYVTVKYNTDGQQQWAESYNGADNQHEYARDLALDDDGNVFITGYGDLDPSTAYDNYDFITVKYDAAGSQQWVATYGAEDSAYDEPMAMATDLNGNVYITGYYLGTNDQYDWLTIRYDNSGALQWQMSYNGAADDWDRALALVVDPARNVYVTGESCEQGSNSDVTTIKYSQLDLFVTLNYYGGAIQIPSSGGGFNYNLTIVNDLNVAVDCDAWFEVLLPDSSLFSPLLGPAALTVSALQTIVRDRTQMVPGSAPPGLYQYIVNVGVYPDTVWDSDQFPFEKLASRRDDTWVEGWMSCEVSQEGQSPNSTRKEGLDHLACYPNVFNQTITITFTLRQDNHVQLRIFNLEGRLITTLIDGATIAGSHHTEWNAANLPSAMYFCQIQAGDYTAVIKMVLAK
jgi:hypothetical protein